MISIVYITNRGLYPCHDMPWREMSQYAILSQSLEAQTFTDFEVVVVDAFNTLPRKELAWLGERVKYVRPRDTPWRRMRAFAPSSARNSGLAEAEGDLIFGLDDCTSFPANLLQLAATSWLKGRCVVPRCVRDDGSLVYLPQAQRRGGVLFYPRAQAIAIGGHEERFDGTPCLEDWAFSEKLAAKGVKWNDDPAAQVILHRHTPHEGKPASVAGSSGYHRCPWAVYRVVVDQPVGNRPWTAEQLNVFAAKVCPYLTEHGCRAQHDLYQGGANPAHFACSWPERPSVEALSIMRTHESSSWLDFGGSNG